MVEQFIINRFIKEGYGNNLIAVKLAGGDFNMPTLREGAPVDAINELWYTGAKKRWPELTPAQFGEAARACAAKMQAGQEASINEMSEMIEVELVRLYGQGSQSK